MFTFGISRKPPGQNISQGYFHLIGEERFRKLYEIYHIDFDMFDYSIESYEALYR